ncbi:MAG: phospholipid carrier-dependent glycosyltransferase [Candidatus Nanopelagicales bacterium]
MAVTEVAPPPAEPPGPADAGEPLPRRVRRDGASLPQRLFPPMPRPAWIGWVGALAVALVGGIIRFVELGRPAAVVFDETYYMKDALSLLRWGYERQFVDDANDLILASDGNWRTLDVFKDDPSFVVHPPFGKWTIAAGEWLFGVTPFGWRFAVAVLGTLSILMVVRIARRLTRSDLIGIAAGLLLALDGIHIVMSRTAVLDMVLSFWVLAAFGFLLLDRDRTRKRLATLVERHGPAVVGAGWGPPLGLRPWRWAAGISLGLACGVKWSGIWFVAAFGLMTVVWDVGTRKAVGVRRPWLTTLVRSGPPAFVAIVGLGVLTYLATWYGWFTNPGGYDRTWADDQPSSFIPAALRSLWHYHAEAWGFHVNLTSDHSYQSNAWSWLLQTRPTSFFYESYDRGLSGCDVDKCSAEVIALGNPIVWWAGALALVHQLWRWVARRDWRSGAVLVGVVAGWAPWLLFQERTIFTFYSVVFVPFLVMALAMSLGTVLGPADASEARRMKGAIAAGGVMLAVVVAAWWFLPVWTGETIPYEMWKLRMWMPTWV